ncbi:MAG: antibiotic biosynthesis monooxygenase [Chlorobi bacterium]|nr:antibiotic biosynthesis monooxygenase [Chlorobiota bacterium]
MNKPVIVTARIKAKQGKTEILKKILNNLTGPSRKEEGCINYELLISDDVSGLFMFYETWRDREALAKHLATPHIREFIGASKELIDGNMQVSLWNQLE